MTYLTSDLTSTGFFTQTSEDPDAAKVAKGDEIVESTTSPNFEFSAEQEAGFVRIQNVMGCV